MDWKGIIREIRLLLKELPDTRFWAVWLLALPLVITFCVCLLIRSL